MRVRLLQGDEDLGVKEGDVFSAIPVSLVDKMIDELDEKRKNRELGADTCVEAWVEMDGLKKLKERAGIKNDKQ
jgi:hypothetical protein